MKLEIAKEKLTENPEMMIRRAGYGAVRYRHEHQPSWARRLGAGHYPRFHVYITMRNGSVVFDLHLDQKEASYSGSRMHSGEYDGETVATEIARLRSIMLISDQSGSANISEQNHEATPGQKVQDSGYQSPLNQMKKGIYDIAKEPAPKRSWWRRILS